MRIETGRSLRSLNSFGVDVTAKHYVELRSAAEIPSLVAHPLFQNGPRFLLGGGSNVLFTGDVDGLVVRVALPGIAVVREDDTHVWVRAGAGEVWHDLVRFSIERGWGGLENLALIPGLVGASPIQNIGAYGVEMASTCEDVLVADLESGEPRTLAAADCAFGYRDSIFKHALRDRVLVMAVTFRLDKQPRLDTSYGDLAKTLAESGVGHPTIRDVSQAVIRIRSSKLPDPRLLGNAGSFFKNPVIPRDQFEALHGAHAPVPHYPQPDGAVKIPAGWLVEQCGWKGRTVGRAGVHAQQAVVLVNHGGASGAEILDLARLVQESVRRRFGIELEPEVQVV